MNGAAPILAALLLAAAGAAELRAGPVPIPHLKPSLEELSNFRAMSDDARGAMYRALAVQLDERLEADPDDLEGWLRLARTRLLLGERHLAIAASERALALAPRSPSVLKSYAALELGPLDAATGWPEVTPGAFALYERLAAIDPDDPEAHWYLGLHALQQGDRQAASVQWRVLLRLLPPGHPSAEAIRERALHEVAEQPAS